MNPTKVLVLYEIQTTDANGNPITVYSMNEVTGNETTPLSVSDPGTAGANTITISGNEQPLVVNDPNFADLFAQLINAK